MAPSEPQQIDQEQEVEEVAGTDLEIAQPHHELALIPAASPAQYIERVTEIANALTDVIESKGLFTTIGRKRFVEVEGWTTLGSLLGSFPGGKSVYAVPDGEPEWIEIDGVKGVKATMKAVTADGQVVGGGTGYCMRNESKWRTSDFYALAGMAQTRATSRALRQPLGFIVKLAGFEATPASERGEDDGGGRSAPQERARELRDADQQEQLLVRVRSGMAQLEPQPQWTEGAILRQAKLLWNSDAETLEGLSAHNLEAIIAAMADQGVTV